MSDEETTPPAAAPLPPPKALVVKGRVVRSGTRGIAVKYYDLKRIHEELIRLFIKTNQ